MKIYRTFSLLPHSMRWEPYYGALRMWCNEHIYTVKSDDRLTLSSTYNEKAIWQFYSAVSYKGATYVRPDWFQLAHFESGKQKILDEDGKALKLDTITAAMISSLPSPWDESQSVSAFHIDGYEGNENSTLFVYDHNSAEVYSRQLDTYVSHYFFFEDVLVLPGRWDLLYGYDKKLNELWSFEVRDIDNGDGFTYRSKVPWPITDKHFVINVGTFEYETKKIENENGDLVERLILKKGLVRAFHGKDGTQYWEREFEYVVDDVLVHEGRIFAFTNNLLLELSPNTGETLNEINTGLRRVTWDSLPIVELFVADNQLYIPYRDEPCVLIYDITSFELIKRIELPGIWRAESVKIQHPETKDIYIGVRERLTLLETDENLYENISGMLKLHPDRLDEPVEFEPMPEMIIELRPSEDQEERDELWVEFDWPYLDDALRFAEIFIQNECRVLGYSFNGQKPNKRFNGKVHWQYSGCEEPAENVREYLAMFEKRFHDWAFEMVLSGDRKEYCSVETTYIES